MSPTANIGGSYIIHKLIQLIDTFRSIGSEIRDLILDLARWMDETKQCRRDEICRKIKNELKEKIAQGKISEKWIEECLPKEYKRRYTKSELSSLSSSGELLSVVDTQGGSSDGGKGSVNSRQEAYPVSINDSRSTDDSSQDLLCELANELEKHLLDTKAVENLIEFMIPKERYESLKVAMQESKNSICVVFKDGILQRAISDIANT
jgi:hypothetical protein